MEATSHSIVKLEKCIMCDTRDFISLPIPQHWVGGNFFSNLDGEIGLVKCYKCKHVFINPRPSLDELNRFYNSSIYECHETSEYPSSCIKADFLLRYISKYLPKNLPKGARRD